MKKTVFSVITFVVLSLGISCTQKTQVAAAAAETDIKKWEKSIINIECQELRYTQEEIDLVIAQEKQEKKILSAQEELLRRGELGRQTNPVSGTAIYFTDNGNRYLVTARHVIFDPEASKLFPTPRLYKDISIRTPYDYYLKRKVNNSSIPSTGYGLVSPFYLSDVETDIGIISLQASLTHYLISTLEEDGYVPINFSDIDTSNKITTGENIAAIGYPDISKIGVFQKKNDYQSNVVVLPVSTFGHIAMAHERLPYFISDITVYPGNSGGPILRKNKLIGIVSGQVLIPADRRDGNNSFSSTSLYSRGSLAKVLKAEYIIKGLRKLQEMEADKNFR